MSVQDSVRLFIAGVVAAGIAFHGDGLMGNGTAQAFGQTPGQIAAQQIRNQAVANAMQERGITLPQSRVSIGNQRFDLPYQSYRSYRPSYSGGYVNPYNSGYSYGYSQPYGGYGFGYGAQPYGHGYGYGFPAYHYRVVPNRSSSSQSNRLPGSHYFGDPHASQYFGP